ncbi:MAG: 4Fe-4S dicluster domain-containing protein [Coriobacteriales bacterium]|nr:4Fe-4S dicluster domain-containing protein [Coriobacteriales bacterium]
MLKTIKEVLRVGDATVKYPFAPIERPRDARGKPEHDSVKCFACSACANACPPNAIQTSLDLTAGTKSWSINYGRCVFCGRCEEVCPVDAIRLSPEFELAVMKKEDLEEICTYSLQRCSECGEFFAPTKAVDYAKRVLAQSNTLNDDVSLALDSINLCMSCKQKQDAHRYWEQSRRAGELLC